MVNKGSLEQRWLALLILDGASSTQGEAVYSVIAHEYPVHAPELNSKQKVEFNVPECSFPQFVIDCKYMAMYLSSMDTDILC